MLTPSFSQLAEPLSHSSIPHVMLSLPSPCRNMKALKGIFTTVGAVGSSCSCGEYPTTLLSGPGHPLQKIHLADANLILKYKEISIAIQKLEGFRRDCQGRWGGWVILLVWRILNHTLVDSRTATAKIKLTGRNLILEYRATLASFPSSSRNIKGFEGNLNDRLNGRIILLMLRVPNYTLVWPWTARGNCTEINL